MHPPLLLFFFFFCPSVFLQDMLQIMSHYDLVLNMSLHTVVRSSLCRWLTRTRYVVSEAPGQAWPPSSPLRSSCSRSRGARSLAAHPRRETHISSCSAQLFPHVRVARLHKRTESLVLETKDSNLWAFRNSARDTLIGALVWNRLNALKWAKDCQQIRATMQVCYCLLKMSALKV